MIRFKHFSVLVIVAAFASTSSFASWIVKQERTGKDVRVLAVQKSNQKAGAQPKVLRSLPTYLREDAPPSSTYEEVLYSDIGLPTPAKAKRQELMSSRKKLENTEVRTLVSQGPKENRINLTILGDGYTLAEKDRFFADATRTKNELFVGQTFASYLPLFNVYAVFVPSQDSGITDGDAKKNTAFSLYRDPPGSKRAIMPGDPNALEEALQLAPATDYPIVLANDEYYGGLGGRFAISTRSIESGIVVLRHELGHNFGQVGEEYDGGYVYTGANSTSSRGGVPWSQWLTDGKLNTYETKFLAGEYVWQNLAQSDFTSDFNFPAPSSEGPYQFEVIVSSVGWKTPGDVTVQFDGQPVTLEGRWTTDRSFFTFHLPQSPSAGQHRLTVHQNIHDGDKLVAFVELYAQPATLDFSKDVYGAYATFSSGGSPAGYRPTHTSCLMRDMLTPNFCSVDKENMWLRFLNRVSLVDSVAYDAASKTVTLQAPELQGLAISWFQVSAAGKESELTALAGKRSWVNTSGLTGDVKAKLSFRTTEVRRGTSRLDAEKTVTLR